MEIRQQVDEGHSTAAHRHIVAPCQATTSREDVPIARVDGVSSHLFEGISAAKEPPTGLEGCWSPGHSDSATRDSPQVSNVLEEPHEYSKLLPPPPQSEYILGANSVRSASTASRTANQLVVSNIEDQIRAIAASLQRQEGVTVSLKVKKQTVNSTRFASEQGVQETLVRFPGRTAQEAWRFGKQSRLAQGVYG